MQVLLLVVVSVCYLSSEFEVRTRHEQTKQLGEMVTHLQAVTMNVQLFLSGQGDFDTINADQREQTRRPKCSP